MLEIRGGRGEDEYPLSNSIRLENVSKIFTLGLIAGKKIVAVDRVSFEIRKGEVLSILGESGSGKTTIARMVLRLLRPTSGRILFGDKDIWRIKGWKAVKEYYKQVQGIFQDPYSSFNPRRRILALLYDTVGNFYPEYRGDREAAKKIIGEALDSVGLSIADIEGKYPHQLSGGQLQRVAIARALIPKPVFIIADEPVSMVDASTRVDILNILIDLKEEHGISSTIIGHDYMLAYYSSDRIIVIYKGQIVEEGPYYVLEDPAHPYTKMLKESVPTIDKRWSQSRAERVKVEQIRKAEQQRAKEKATRKGCPFAPRCPYRMPICEKEEPPTVNLGKARVKCWLYASK